ncbi:5'-methylthioadenosine/S-adenosylhomocysteine nucleosidase family protein [Streptomyces sp. NBC_01483]|uniref:5'-methylthioadenosine/S-adenosylhomocysteine nucleosidase family protein n=1 Tax=Streptomyces sp. NBC_01483 TaxID=2903883 RepID=UPI003FCD8DF5
MDCRRRPRAGYVEPSADVVVLTALPVEFQAVLLLLRDQSTLVHPEGTRFVQGALPGVAGTVAISRIGAGNLTSAVMVERVRQWLRPQALLFVGVAGGLKPEARLGDVVVSTKVHYLHLGKETPEGFNARPVPGAVSHRLEQAAGIALCSETWRKWVPDEVRATWQGTGPHVHFQPIIAGEVVLNSPVAPLRDQITFHYGMARTGEAGQARLGRRPVAVAARRRGSAGRPRTRPVECLGGRDRRPVVCPLVHDVGATAPEGGRQ